MIRYLEVPDMHADPAWMEHTIAVGEAVRKAAIDNSVDFIAVPGDLFNRPLFASDRSRYSDLVGIIKSWLKVCPVVAIEGTPSHDGPGAYGPLEELGLVLLRPGRTYGLTLDDDIREIDGVSFAPGKLSALLYGIPELNTNQSTANDAEGRAGETVTNLRRYLEEFIAPRRAMFPNVPAVGLLHGVVSDSTRENDSDIIKKQSSLLIHTEDLALAGLDRWSLGDIHTPWESQRISAGYAGFTGMDGNPWGKTGFVPAMNLVEVSPSMDENGGGHLFHDGDWIVNVSRIPYGSPRREKITSPLETYDPDVAYWLASETDDPELNPANHGAHPWSRVTFEKEKTETRRVTKEEAEKATTLSDLARLMDPEGVTDSIAAKLDDIDTGRSGEAYGASADLLSLTVAGCVFFRGRTATLNAAELPRALVELHGNDNGSGKSSLLCFATPYPTTVGRDTESGRPSAIHEFFSEKESYIEKIFQVGDETHRHLLTIKGAHTQTRSIEAFLYIDGVNILNTKSFDEMAATCERLYGPMEDHLLTAFNVQPEQSKNVKSIAASTPTELRERVLRISGIDRSAENARANAEVKDAELKSSGLTAKIEARQADVDDIPAIKKELAEAKSKEKQAHERLALVEADKSREADRVAELAPIAERSRSEARAKAQDGDRIAGLQAQNRSDEQRRSGLELLIATRSDDVKILAVDDENRKRVAELEAEKREVDEENRDDRERFDREDRAYNRAFSEIEDMKSKRDSLIWTKDDRLKNAGIIADPCEECGHISNANRKRVDEYKAEADAAHLEAQILDHKLSGMKAPEQPEPYDPIAFTGSLELASISIMPEHARRTHQDSIAQADKAQATIDEIVRQIATRREEMAQLGNKTYQIDQESERAHGIAMMAHSEASQAAERIKNEAITASYTVANAEGRLEVSERAAKQSTADRLELSKIMTEASDWRWIAAAMRPNKLPAFELDMLLDEIDDRATRYVEPFREGTYSIRTETQGVGKTGVVDRFRVLVHDGEMGIEKSLLKFSGGEKVFLADAYQKALLDVRKERRGVMHEPVVFDETDGAIRPERIAEYYRMQTDYFAGVRTLVVSHAPDAQNYIQNRVEIEEVLS